MLKDKNILIGITGGIAAYKICELVRMFIKENANVKVVVTPNALEFVTELTLETLSNERIYTEQFNVEEKKPEHISLCDWADLFVIAPASANTIGKLANGIADNLLTSLACAFQKPVLVAPAMNSGMWENKFVCENIQKLKSSNYTIIEPDTGFLACGVQGKGRLTDLEVILEEAKKLSNPNKFLKNKKIIITAGGTRENIDPARYIGNFSSGKMGIALADKAYQAGADVVLVSTVDTKKPYKVKKVTSAIDMKNAIEENFPDSDALIMAAAVADYRPIEVCASKIKKDNNDEITVKLVKNPDILSEMCKIKTSQTVVGFCAESENLIENAKSKIQKKGCDYIAANDISRSDIGFSSDYNEITVLDKNLKITKIERDTKENIAEKLLEIVFGE